MASMPRLSRVSPKCRSGLWVISARSAQMGVGCTAFCIVRVLLKRAPVALGQGFGPAPNWKTPPGDGLCPALMHRTCRPAPAGGYGGALIVKSGLLVLTMGNHGACAGSEVAGKSALSSCEYRLRVFMPREL